MLVQMLTLACKQSESLGGPRKKATCSSTSRCEVVSLQSHRAIQVECRTLSADVTKALTKVAALDMGHLLLAKAYKEGQLAAASSMASQLQVGVNAQVRLPPASMRT